MNRLAVLFLFFFSTFFSLFAYQGQSQELPDSLAKALEKDPTGPATLNTIADYYKRVGTKEGLDSVIFYARRAMEESKQKQQPGQQIAALLSLAWASQNRDFPASKAWAGEALQLAKSKKLPDYEFEVLKLMASMYYYKGKLRLAKHWSFRVIQKAGELGKDAVTFKNGIGSIYVKLSMYDSAVFYYKEALNSLNDTTKSHFKGEILQNLGIIYLDNLSENEKALVFFHDAYDIYSSLQRDAHAIDLAQVAFNIGVTYSELEETEQAKAYLKEALAIFEEYEIASYISRVNTQLADILRKDGNYEDALDYAGKALENYKANNNREGQAIASSSLGQIHEDMGNLLQARTYYEDAQEGFQALDMKQNVLDVSKDLAKLNEKMGNYQAALNYYKNYSNLKDTVLRERNLEQINDLRTRYETEKKEREIKLQKVKIARQQTLNYALIAGGFLVLAVAALAYRSYLIKKRANNELALRNAEIIQQRDEIEAQRDEIERQRDVVVTQKEEITDSILYASRIQQALLPPDDFISDLLPDYFVFNRPRDIVSGDYYWMAERGDKLYVVAADCTGHGVPGAFMSMLGISFLNEILSNPDITHANEVLERLRKYVIESLRQTPDAKTKDGMDLALVILDKNNRKAEFAGAYNPLYIIRNGELIEKKADRMPIGIYFRGLKPFTNHEVELEKNDQLYIFSDGFVDQFGGEKGRKYMSKRFKKFLVDIHAHSMEKQRELIEQEYDNWRGYNEPVDDVLVVGVKIS